MTTGTQTLGGGLGTKLDQVLAARLVLWANFSPVEAHAREKAGVELLPVCGGESLQERAVGDGRRVADLAPVVLHARRARLSKRVGQLVALLRGVRSAKRATSIQYAPWEG